MTLSRNLFLISSLAILSYTITNASQEKQSTEKEDEEIALSIKEISHYCAIHPNPVACELCAYQETIYNILKKAGLTPLKENGKQESFYEFNQKCPLMDVPIITAIEQPKKYSKLARETQKSCKNLADQAQTVSIDADLCTLCSYADANYNTIWNDKEMKKALKEKLSEKEFQLMHEILWNMQHACLGKNMFFTCRVPVYKTITQKK